MRKPIVTELFLVPRPEPQTAGDTQARTVALDITRSFLVEAPAGSGKTGLLIQRFLKLLAAEHVTDPAQILAITFTRKATLEMRDRVLSQLQAAALGTEPTQPFDRLTRPLALAALEQDRRQGWNLLEYPRRLNIRTIDSVCADIARSLPILSGSSGALAPTEDAAALFVEAARRTLMQLGGEDTALSLALEHLLLHRDASLIDCESLIASMLQWRDQWGELIPISPSDLDDASLEANVLPRLNNALDLAICRGLTRLSNALPQDVLNTLCTLAAEMGQSEGYRGSVSPIAICVGRYAVPGEKAEHLDHWRALIHLLVTPSSQDFRKGLNVNHLGFLIEPSHKKQLVALIDRVRHDSALCATLCSVNSLPPASFPPEQWAVAKSLFRILSRALIELQLVFAEHALCDFTELGLLARAALRRDEASSIGDSQLTHATGLNLQHLLVDEMQDTSTSQYELIQLLTQRWDGHSQTVFLVGDPKQSIYLFRQARVERFVQTMHRQVLGDLPLTTLHLTANFRSQARLVEAFNDDFTRLFPAAPSSSEPELVPYLPAQPARSPGLALARIWHTHALPYTPDAAARSRLQTTQRLEDAQQIRRRIELCLARPLPPERTEPWRIAVLVRTRSHLLEIVAALKQPAPIPFRAVEIEPLAERQEILDLLALTRALLHPADRTAWLALLRTPWCGLTLADLHLLAGADDPALAGRTVLELIESRGDLLTEDGIARLTPFYTVLQAALTERGRTRIAPWVERTWRIFRADLFCTPEELTNVESFLNLLDELELPGGRLDLPALVLRLQRLFAAASVHPGAVDLMTIHGAKGLEWDAVFVPSLERTAQSSRGRLLSWLEVDSGGDTSIAPGILAPIQSKGRESQELNRWMRSIEAAREAAERKRLFYVACTRAREELHLFAAPSAKKEGGLAIPANSLLQAAWPAAEDHFAPSPVLQMPHLPPAGQPAPERIAIAASATRPSRVIQRIPFTLLPLLNPVGLHSEPHPQGSFERPEGSFVARTFGNVVHDLLEQLAEDLASGKNFQSLLEELPAWSPRIVQLLRAGGLAPATLARQAARATLALSNTLNHAEGRWLLSPHPGARSEESLTTSGNGSRTKTIRIDRSFRAGEKPLSEAETHRWIVDFKTAAPGGRQLADFLAEERIKYEPQMQAYGNAFSTQALPIRFALYYPLIPTLLLL